MITQDEISTIKTDSGKGIIYIQDSGERNDELFRPETGALVELRNIKISQ